ncbi:MAG: DEAD/DEAH box helicase [Deltaproteobacteria bacterium]|nr:DEAD/DEAH box helicase [Deltaproteobacteria bacterium]
MTSEQDQDQEQHHEQDQDKKQGQAHSSRADAGLSPPSNPDSNSDPDPHSGAGPAAGPGGSSRGRGRGGRPRRGARAPRIFLPDLPVIRLDDEDGADTDGRGGGDGGQPGSTAAGGGGQGGLADIPAEGGGGRRKKKKTKSKQARAEARKKRHQARDEAKKKKAEENKRLTREKWELNRDKLDEDEADDGPGGRGEGDATGAAGRRDEKKLAAEELRRKTDAQGYFSNEVGRYFDLIGQPTREPFVADPFQLEAVELVASFDTIVSAPTGSGKTWIANRAIRDVLESGGRAWYASPLKALSNSKFLEFGREFGEDKVGLLTGDHKINTPAPILVGTTEILRNQLYDNMSGECSLDYDLVVLDEAHYLGDLERGMVWEETLIYMPPRVRFLLLSATIENAGEIAAWMSKNRDKEVKVVYSEERPVPLVPLCLDYNNISMLEKTSSKRRDNQRDRWRREGDFPKQFESSHYPSDYGRGPGGCLRLFENLNLLPVIFFLKSRKDCDNAVAMTSARTPGDTPEKKAGRIGFIESYCQKFPFLEDYAPVHKLKTKGVAAHHAGHLPQFKMLVEELMTRNLISAIYATSTVAAGVNFPARTVVISNSDHYNGSGFVDLTATDLTQMTGRAGRRGLDKIGFAISVPGRFMDIGLMKGLFKSSPEPIVSNLTVNFPMVLNLLSAFEPRAVKTLLSKSLAAWQRARSHSKQNLDKAAQEMWLDFKRHQNLLRKMALVDREGRLTPDGEIAKSLRLDQPLILYAAISGDGLPLEPPMLAAVMASLQTGDLPAANAGFGRGFRPPTFPGFMEQPIARLKKSIKDVVLLLKNENFPTPDNLAAKSGAAIHAWAVGRSCFDAAEILQRDPGDLVRLALLVAEQLNQLAHISELGTLAEAARAARKLIMREPVV